MTDFFSWVEVHPHTTTLITTLIGVVLAIFGWFFVAWRNRKLEVEKMRLPLRVDMLKKAIICLEVFKESASQENYSAISLNDRKQMSAASNLEIQLVGTKEELKLWRDFCDSLQVKDPDQEIVRQAFIKLVSLLIEDLRKELFLPVASLN